MISGARIPGPALTPQPRRAATAPRRRREALLLGAALLWAGAAPARAFDLDALMGLLAARRGGEARFTEQRFVRGFDAPLQSSGTLSFTAPDRLARRTLQPRPESMVVEGNTVTLSRGGRSRTLALDSAPEVQGVVEALRGTLAGDAAGLQRHFRSTLSGGRDDWALALQPTDPRLAAQLTGVRLTGRAGEVLTVEMGFVGGDRSVTFIAPGATGASGAP